MLVSRQTTHATSFALNREVFSSLSHADLHSWWQVTYTAYTVPYIRTFDAPGIRPGNRHVSKARLVLSQTLANTEVVDSHIRALTQDSMSLRMAPTGGFVVPRWRWHCYDSTLQGVEEERQQKWGPPLIIVGGVSPSPIQCQANEGKYVSQTRVTMQGNGSNGAIATTATASV
jgi:hypothetical protein